jgi:hypothetical protein
MGDNNIFEVATRAKLRFQHNGWINVEDLWDLSVESLDQVFKKTNALVKTMQEESLLDTRSQENQELDTKIAIIKHIVNTKLAEKAARLHAREQREERQRLMEVLSSKKDEELKNKSVEELEAMINT